MRSYSPLRGRNGTNQVRIALPFNNDRSVYSVPNNIYLTIKNFLELSRLQNRNGEAFVNRSGNSYAPFLQSIS